MRYRSISDRTISAYGALLIITLVGAVLTLFIVHTIAETNFTYEAEAGAAGYQL